MALRFACAYELFPGDMIIIPKFKVDYNIYIFGNVNRPGKYRYEEGLNVIDSISMAGGIRTVDDIFFMKIKTIKVIRKSNSLKKNIITLDAKSRTDTVLS